jgi:peptide/nickel transport system substrate-binding protein
MRSRTRNVLATTAGLLIAVMIASAAYAQTATPASSSGSDVVLRVGVIADLDTDNVFAVSAGSDYTVATSEYDMLLSFSSKDLTAAPGLATGCDHNGDYTTWTCQIRPDLKWSDGQPLTSEDIAFTYRFVIDNKIPQYKSYFPSDPTFETPNPTTFIWKAKEPTFAPEMPPWVYIVPEHIWAPYDGKDLKTIRDVSQTPGVGSGPFILSSWTPGQSFVMTRNPYYWGPTPTLDRIEYSVYTNQEAMIQALKNGEIDAIDGLQPSLINSVQNSPNVALQKVVSDWWLNLAFNFGGQPGSTYTPLPALHDLTVRKAIEMAIDKNAIVQKVYQGAATPGDTIVRPASAFWHLDIPSDKEFGYNPTAANQMLDDAGYADTNQDGIREDPKTGQPLEMRIPASTDTTGAEEAGQLIVGYLKQIGIKVDLLPATDAKMNDYWGSGNFDAYIWYWSGDPDPNYQLFVFTSDQCGYWSDGCWKDSHFDSLYNEQHTEMNQTKRQALVKEAQQYEYDQVPGVVLAYPNWLEAYRTDRFTGWVGQPGADGYLLPTYNYDTWLYLHPIGETSSSSSSGIPGWVWLVAAVVIAGIVVMVMRRGRKIEPDEA